MILKTADDRSDQLRRLEDQLPGSRGERQARIAQEIRDIRTGIWGDRITTEILDGSQDVDSRMGILHDIRIKDASGEPVHIDHVLVQRVRGVAWAIESLSATMRCNEHGDWSISHGGAFKPVPSPQDRARRNAVALQNWFRRQCIASIRQVTPLVLVSSDSTIYREQGPGDVEVLKIGEVPGWCQRQSGVFGFGSVPAMVMRLGIPRMSDSDLRILGHRIARTHEAPSIEAVLRDDATPLELETYAPPVQKPSASPAPPAYREIDTRHGKIRLHPLGNGFHAIRHADNDELTDAVRWACHGRADWDKRARNWFVSEAALAEVLHELG